MALKVPSKIFFIHFPPGIHEDCSWEFCQSLSQDFYRSFSRGFCSSIPGVFFPKVCSRSGQNFVQESFQRSFQNSEVSSVNFMWDFQGWWFNSFSQDFPYFPLDYVLLGIFVLRDASVVFKNLFRYFFRDFSNRSLRSF